MYGRSEKRDSTKSGLGHHEDIAQLFSMLELSEPQTVEDVKKLIQENLSGTKDVWLLHRLVDYYIIAQSNRSLDILVRVREPHDKHLFDKITECMKNESTRHQALLLLSHIVYRQPSWLFKITQHRVTGTMLNLLKTETDPPNLMCALLTVVSLLPMYPSQFGPLLNDLFEIFSRLASWSTKIPAQMSEVFVLHLQVGVYSLFHRLYGMFPCNFLAYLRSYYGSRDYSQENHHVFTVTIKPMLERVRLHPLLVTASKESELNAKRWKKMESHDVIVDCARVSLDAIECSHEVRCRSNVFGSGTSGQSNSNSVLDSSHFVSCSSQSSNMSVTLDPNSLVNRTVNSTHESIWSPSLACGLSTPPPIVQQHHTFEYADAIRSESGHKFPIPQTFVSSDNYIPLDIAIEAKPEGMKDEEPFQRITSQTNLKDLQSSDNDSLIAVTCADNAPNLKSDVDALIQEESTISNKKNSDDLCSDFVDVIPAIEAKEEDVIDKEVSDLTDSPGALLESSLENRQNTPFCFTTQNLTAEPLAINEQAESFLKDQEDDTTEELELSAETECGIGMEGFAKTMSRIRYLSYCGLPPKSSLDDATRQRSVRRSSSWPKIQQEFSHTVIDHENHDCNFIDKPSIPEPSLNMCIEEQPVSCSFMPLKNSLQSSCGTIPSTCTLTTTYDHLVSMSAFPYPIPVKLSTSVTETRASFSTEPCASTMDLPFYAAQSPFDLLDRYLQLGTETYLNQLNTIPLTSSKNTNWTHFGGQPPADEVMILRKQITMLHSQLLFERHLREIHGERNRRLLGKAKRSRTQEECTEALRDQVQMLTKDIEVLKTEFKQQFVSYHQLQKSKKNSEDELQCQVKKLVERNDDLTFSNKNLQNILLLQGEEKHNLTQEFKESQAKLLGIQYELELNNKDIERYKKLEKDVTKLTKEIVLLRELNSIYKDKVELLKEPRAPEAEIDLIKESARTEVSSTRQMLDNKTLLLDCAKSKVSELELYLSTLKLKLAEQGQLMENMKSLHKEEIVARDERLSELQKMTQQKEVHILELYHRNEVLSQDLITCKKSIKNSSFNLQSASNACAEATVHAAILNENVTFSPQRRPSLIDATLPVDELAD